MWDPVLHHLHDLHNWLLVGLMLLLGHAGGKLAGLCRLPSVVGYLVVGVLLGNLAGAIAGSPEHNLVTHECADQLGLVTDFGLGVVAFMIGSELSGATFKRTGKVLASVLLGESLGAVLTVLTLVCALGWLVLPAGVPMLPAALIFGAMAAATAPAGTLAVVQECKAKGPFTRMLLAVAGLDDGVAIVLYAFTAAVAKAFLSGRGPSVASALGWPALEIFGSLAVGALAGALLTALLRRTRSRAETLTLTLGLVLLVTGVANAGHMSLILANLAVGVAVANLSARESERAATALSQVTHPVFVLFFVVAGAHLDLSLLAAAGLLMPVYVIGRSAGKMGGSWLGARLSGAGREVRRYLGLGLLPQAGVAVGLALLVAREFGQMGETAAKLGKLVINTIAATTIFFEIVGPITAKIALAKSGEIGVKKEEAGEEQ